MRSAPVRYLAALALAAILAVASALSAGRMGPDAQAGARAAALASLGAQASDLCLDDGAGHDHRCPFCHALPHPPRATAPDAARIAAFAAPTFARRDLGAPRNPALAPLSPRAPPPASRSA